MPEEQEAKSGDNQSYWDTVKQWMKSVTGLDYDDQSLNRNDNDWLLVIKLHAMIETALNSTLVMHFGAPELEKVISQLPTSESTTGKVVFASKLEIINKQAEHLIRKLSKMRNWCVHDTRNFNFSLVGYFASLDPSDRNDLRNRIINELPPTMTFGQNVLTATEVLDQTPQYALILATLDVMFQIHTHYKHCQHRDAIAEINRLKALRFDEQNQSTPSQSSLPDSAQGRPE